VTTATLVPKNKRVPAPTERADLRRAIAAKRATAADEVEAIAGLILAGTSINTPIDPSLIAPIASACSCLDLGPEYTITTTSTDVPAVRIVQICINGIQLLTSDRVQ
jgi:chaperone required for assembly of F1-ATPase